jgi:hypothetical protein
MYTPNDQLPIIDFVDCPRASGGAPYIDDRPIDRTPQMSAVTSLSLVLLARGDAFWNTLRVQMVPEVAASI